MIISLPQRGKGSNVLPSRTSHILTILASPGRGYCKTLFLDDLRPKAFVDWMHGGEGLPTPWSCSAGGGVFNSPAGAKSPEGEPWGWGPAALAVDEADLVVEGPEVVEPAETENRAREEVKDSTHPLA